jgi:hypothetical protein
VSPLKAEQPRAKTDRKGLNTDPKELGHDKVAKLVQNDGRTKDKYESEGNY